MDQIVETSVMFSIENELIIKIQNFREKRGWSQRVLSPKVGVASSFVGNVENLNERYKYSIRHIALLSKAFNYKSPSKLFKFPSPEYDEVMLRIKVTKENLISTKEVKKLRNLA